MPPDEPKYFKTNKLGGKYTKTARKVKKIQYSSKNLLLMCN
jgi:hypothetical protein